MNIIIINDYASIQGGSAQVAVQSAFELASNGHYIVYIYATGTPDAILNHKNIKLISFEQYDLLNNPSKVNASITGIWNKTIYKNLSSILGTYNNSNTIIHLHSWVKSLSISTLKAIFDSKISLVITLHDYFTACPNGGFYNYKAQKLCTLKPMSTKCITCNCDSRNYSQKIWRLARQKFYHHIKFYDKALNFITVSQLSQNLLNPYLSKESKYWRIRNPINIEKNDSYIPSRSKMFTFIGRLSPEKGVLLLTQLKSIPPEKIQFIGTGELEPHLKNILPSAKFHGWCNSEKIQAILQDTRALLFTSQWYETQGMVVSEAAAYGIPSIVSDITAASEFIADKRSGLLFKSGSPEDLDIKILELLNDELVDFLGSHAYQDYWSNPPTPKNHSMELLECYNELLKHGKNSDDD